MRYVRIKSGSATGWATLSDNDVQPLDRAPYDGGHPAGPAAKFGEVCLLAPVEPSKIFCVGRNYSAHRAEMGYQDGNVPSVFLKGPSTLIGPGDNIVLPPQTMSNHVEHEAELAIVIGKTARFVKAADAMDFIFGYTCANDVSARDLQRSDPQLTRGKGFDTFCPVGPWIETELDPVSGVRLSCSVNGTVRQDASTADMTYSIAYLIEFLTGFATLCPGDLILTGSPGGTEAIRPGDEIDITIAGIGTLSTGVAGAESHVNMS